MSPRTPLAGLAVLAIGGGLVLATSQAAASQTTLADPVHRGSITDSVALGAGTSATVAGLTQHLGEPLGASGRNAPDQSRTGDLPSGRVVPMEDFRVGPFYGRVGGPHSGGSHGGLDMGADSGEPIYAVSDGKVTMADWQGAAGKAVTIRTDNGKLVLYGRMSRIIAEKGDKVKAGDKIGLVGSTGNSTGPHLHLQVNRPNGQTMDPLVWMDVSAKQLAKQGRD